MEKLKLTQRDTGQIHKNEHDEDLNARRVTIVGNGMIDLEIDTSKVSEALTEAVRAIKFDRLTTTSHPNSKIEVVEVPVQVFIPQIETKLIEIPVIVKEVQIIEVERPIITESVRIIEVEKPITIEKYVERLPAWAWSLIITQLFAIGGLVYKLLL